MKILILHSELGVLRGGGENFTRNLFTAFVERGHHISAAFVADYRGRYPIPLPTPIEPIPIPGWWSANLGQATLSHIGLYLSRSNQLRKKWDRIQAAISWRVFRWYSQRFQRRIERKFAGQWRNFDAVYVHGSTMLASKVARYRPTVLRLPGPVGADLAPALRTIHAVCANGDALARIRIFLGEKALELPIGINGELFALGSTSIREALGWTARHQVVGYVGRLTHLKGVTLLANAFREISPVAADARLLIVGKGEDERSIRSILATELSRGLAHIEPDVDHEHLSQWYRAMDVFVMPSRYENFSNAVLEAMACGIPILASSVGGNRLLEETRAGWLFQPDSVSALSAGMRGVLENRSEMKDRGEAGYRYVQERYSWMTSAERLAEIIASHLGVKE